MASRSLVERLIRQSAARYGVDPAAALAVASTEGGIRFGAVGDHGTSFGPFQLHRGGALPRGKSAGWANSRAGIDYAVRSMANAGARGKRGRAAINAIVRRFERPADPDSQVAKAISRYKQFAGGSPARSPIQPTGFGGGGAVPRRALMQFVLANQAAINANDPAAMSMNLIGMMQSMRQAAASGSDLGTGGFGASPRSRAQALAKGILGGKKWRDLGGPEPHGAKAQNRIWQNMNAVDVGAPAGTPVYAVRGGRISGGFGGSSNSAGTIYGKRLTVSSGKNNFFYTHLGRYARGIKPGAKVRKGQLLGFIGKGGPGMPTHVHFASQYGNPYSFI